MRELVGIAVFLALGLAVSQRWLGRVRAGRFGRFFYLTGAEFLVLGLLLSPRITGVLDRATLQGLEPFVGLGLGYLGFVFGLQFEAADLRRLPGRMFAASAALNGVVLATLFGSLGWVLARGGDASVPLALALAASGLGTSTAFLFLVDRHTSLGRNPTFRFLRFCSAFDDLWGVVLFGAALCWFVPGGWIRLAQTLGFALASSVILLGAMGVARTREAELPVLAGTVLFTGGLSAYAGLSPVLVNAVAGCIVANAHPGARAAHDRLLRVEKPIYFLMLLVAGAWWGLLGGGAWLVTAVYVAARFAGKIAGGAAAGWVLNPRGGVRSLGWGVLAQSEMSVALMVNLMLLFPSHGVSDGAAAVLTGVIVNDLVSSAYYGWAYRKA
ncbi:cation:proton antiporter [Deferrisoma camini]|uniref:hypothetical protein n=1 Tax=Deferrisoma camini TaxID=1035120 RepID=UPI00046D6774|nr:hypothetical protein [Deferrisoma camini]